MENKITIFWIIVSLLLFFNIYLSLDIKHELSLFDSNSYVEEDQWSKESLTREEIESFEKDLMPKIISSYNDEDSTNKLYELFWETAKSEVSLEQIKKITPTIKAICEKIDSYSYKTSQNWWWDAYSSMHWLFYNVQCNWEQRSLIVTIVKKWNNIEFWGFNIKID